MTDSLIIPKKLRRISALEKRSLLARALKMNEEAGELSAEVLKLVGEKGRHGKTDDEVKEHLWLEAIDTLTVCMDILLATGATQEKIDEIFNQQMDKWEAKMSTERLKKVDSNLKLYLTLIHATEAVRSLWNKWQWQINQGQANLRTQ